jgi:hypothetical protein
MDAHELALLQWAYGRAAELAADPAVAAVSLGLCGGVALLAVRDHQGGERREACPTHQPED